MRKSWKWFAPLLVAVLVGLLAMPVQTVAAQDDGPDYARLELYYERLLLGVDGLNLRLDGARLIIDRAYEIIDRLEEEGIDASDLAAAVADFEQAVNDTQVHADAAAAILAEHAGFDDAGQVIDRDTAVATLRSARAELRDGHLLLRGATIDFRQAVIAFREKVRSGADG